MRVAVIVCLFGAGLIGQVRGAPPSLCNSGTFAACHSLSAAAQCEAVDYCIDAVWADERLPPDSTSLCSLCTRGIGHIRAQPNQTAAAISSHISDICQPLVLHELTMRCLGSLNTWPQEMEVVIKATQVSPITICTIAGLCHPHKPPENVPTKVVLEKDQQLDRTTGVGVQPNIILLPQEAKRERRQVDRIPIKCNKGMKFWCSSTENARFCDKTNYCMRKVWPKNYKPSQGKWEKKIKIRNENKNESS